MIPVVKEYYNCHLTVAQFIWQKVIFIFLRVMWGGNKFRCLRTCQKPVILLRSLVIENFQMQRWSSLITWTNMAKSLNTRLQRTRTPLTNPSIQPCLSPLLLVEWKSATGSLPPTMAQATTPMCRLCRSESLPSWPLVSSLKAVYVGCASLQPIKHGPHSKLTYY